MVYETSASWASVVDDTKLDAHLFMGEQACLFRDSISIDIEDTPGCIMEGWIRSPAMTYHKCQATKER